MEMTRKLEGGIDIMCNVSLGIRERALEEGIEKGIEQGLVQGIEQNTKDIILSMINNNATLEFISKVTNKSIKEIEQIIKEQ